MSILKYIAFHAITFTLAASADTIAQLKQLTVNDQKSYRYITITDLTPGQLRYSQLNVNEKIAAARKKNSRYNNNTSILSTPLPVILAPFGPVLVDGHHDTLASIALGATTIPVFVLQDFSTLTVEEFWQQATKEGLVYPYTLDNKYQLPTTFDALQDDPNRFFAALIARKCVKDPNTGAMIAVASPKTKLGDYPVWIKFGNKIPFIEFKISDTLKAHGLVYNNAWGENVSVEFVEAARAILLKYPITGLKVIPVRTKVIDNSPAAHAVCKDE